MNRISFRSIRVVSALAFTLALTAASFSETPSAPHSRPEQLSKQQLKTLIATAATPVDHQRIAQYYQAKAQDYLSQAKEHEAMLAAYNASPSALTDKDRAGTVYHCQYYARKFKDMAAQSEDLARLHAQMAADATHLVHASTMGK
jgi:hypothetical protein